MKNRWGGSASPSFYLKASGLLAALALTACGLHNATIVPPAASGSNARAAAAGPADAATQAQLSFGIPEHGRQFVSAHTQVVKVFVDGQIVLNERLTSGTTRYNRTFAVPAGRETFVIELQNLYNETLSAALLHENIPSGKTTRLQPVFGGVPAGGSLQISATAPPVGVPAVLQLTLNAQDADREPIASGAYFAPVLVRYDDPSGHAPIDSTSFSMPGQKIAIHYDGKTMSARATATVVRPKDTIGGANFVGQAYGYVPTPEWVRPMAIGPNHTLWYAVCFGNNCSIRTVDEQLHQQTLAKYPAQAMVMGPDGNMWMAGFGLPGPKAPTVVKMDAQGHATYYVLHQPAPHEVVAPTAMTVGPDGAIWVVESDRIARVTTSGSVTEYPSPVSGARPFALIAGSGGKLYFDTGGPCATTDPCNVYSVDMRGKVQRVGSRQLDCVPLVWHAGRLICSGNGVFALDPSGKVQQLKTPGRWSSYVPLATDSRGRMFGLVTCKSGPAPQCDGPVALIEQTGNLLTGTSYPVGSGVPIGTPGFPRMAVSDDGYVWMYAQGDYVLGGRGIAQFRLDR